MTTPPPDSSGSPLGGMLRRLAPMIYGPTVLFSLGEGAVLPILPIIALDLGANAATAALVVSALVIGQLVGNLPAGAAVARVGERVTMLVAAGIGMVGIAIIGLASSLWALATGIFVVGFCAASFALARHSFMTTRVPVTYRARALALLGGSFRLGMFVGPFVAAGLIAIFGDEYAAIWFFIVCLGAMAVLVLFGRDPNDLAAPSDARSDGASPAADEADTGEAISGGLPAIREGVFRTMARHRAELARLGLAAACLSAVRAARPVALPIWGASIGLDSGTIALVVGVSGAIDFALFYASGQVMDRFGRLWAALPAMLLMGAGFIALGATYGLDEAAMWYAMFAMVIGVGNGLSSGILLTLGADLAPRSNPAPFLGSWRLCADTGGALAPLLISGITAAVSLSLAVGTIGVISLVGAAAFVRWIPRYIPRTD